jgi:hypothetical protein
LASRQRHWCEISPLLINLASAANQLCNKRQITVLCGHEQRRAPPAVLGVRIDASGQQGDGGVLPAPQGLTERSDFVARHVVRGHAARSIDLSSILAIPRWSGARSCTAGRSMIVVAPSALDRPKRGQIINLNRLAEDLAKCLAPWNLGSGTMG